MAEAVPGTSEQRLQEFLTNMQWDEHDLNRQRVEKMIAETTIEPITPRAAERPASCVSSLMCADAS